MLGRILLFVVLVPLIELALLNQLLLHTSFITTLIVVILTGFVGVQLARRQGRQAWQAIQQRARSGSTPTAEITEGILILLAAVFLISPGLLTDTAGILLLQPRIRGWVNRNLRQWFRDKTHVTVRTETWQTVPPEKIINVEDDEVPRVRVIKPRKKRKS